MSVLILFRVLSLSSSRKTSCGLQKVSVSPFRRFLVTSLQLSTMQLRPHDVQ